MLQRYTNLLLFGGERRSGATAPPKVWRRLFHISAGSSIPIVGIFLAHDWMIAAMVVVAGGGLAIDLARFNFGWLNRHYMRWLAPLLKSDESAHITGATYMVVAGLLLFLLYGKDVAVPAMFFLSLGDPAAAVAGSRLRGPRFRGKSPGGTLAFVGVGAATAAVLVAAGGIDHHWALWVGAVVAGLVELASIPPDDNFTIPILAGTAMYLMGA